MQIAIKASGRISQELISTDLESEVDAEKTLLGLGKGLDRVKANDNRESTTSTVTGLAHEWAEVLESSISGLYA